MVFKDCPEFLALQETRERREIVEFQDLMYVDSKV